MTENKTNDEPATDRSQSERYLSRRRYLAAAGVTAGAGVLAGCGGGDQSGGNETTGAAGTTVAETATAGETTDQTAAATTEGGATGDSYSYTKQQLKQKYPGLEILSPEPPNGQADDLATYTSFLTGVDSEYIRSHYNSPKIDEAEHTISFTGLSDDEAEISMEELKRDYPTESVVHTMQCSGNGRSYFEPQVAGNPWSFGATDTARYTGTPLSAVLEAYGADTSDEMWLSVMGEDAPEGEDVFARSIPMQKATDDCMLAYERNGSALTAEHGFPVRLIVPGWYGCNNVKWLGRMHVMEKMLYGPQWNGEQDRTYTHWQQSSYRIIPVQDEEPKRYETIDTFDVHEQMQNTDEIRNAYMYDQLVKSLIGYPGQDATVSPGIDGTVEVVGVAWAGDDEVDGVEISTDGGETWNDAEFFGPSPGPAAWRQYRYRWDADPGDYTLASRATDGEGRTQPATISKPDENLRGITDDKYPWNKDGYGSNAYMPESVDVTVTSGGDGNATGGNASSGNATGGNATSGNATTGNETSGETTIGNPSGDTTAGGNTSTTSGNSTTDGGS